MVRELMAITGLTAQELVHLARSACGAPSATVSAARAAAMGIFLTDGITGDGMGLNLIGKCPPFVEQCIAYGKRCRPPGCICNNGYVDVRAISQTSAYLDTDSWVCLTR